MPALQLLGDGIIQSISQLAVIGGTVVLLLMLAALVGFAYKQLMGDGVEWPDEDSDEDEVLRHGDADDEWDYY